MNPGLKPEEEVGGLDLVRRWRDGEIWFRRFLPEGVPWGGEECLSQVPDDARDSWGVRVGGYVRLDGRRYEPGEIVLAESEQGFLELLRRMGPVTELVTPGYERLVPASLAGPQERRIDLGEYRRESGARFLKGLTLTAAFAGTGFVVPFLLFPALLAATLYGLFPLVEGAMALLRRPDRLSVEEINRRLVNFEFFRRWLTRQRSPVLNFGLGVLVAVFVAQMVAGTESSIEAAALVKERVFGGGEWWRLVTTGLMHGSVIHILFNGMALHSLGRVLVALVSPPLLAFVFLATVVTGSLASLWFGPAAASVGASGGILGCLGFLLVVTMKFRAKLPGFLHASLLQSTFVVAIFGLLGSGFIDNAAHAGGFFGGVVLGGAASPWLRLAPVRARPSVLAISSISLAVLAAGVVKVLWELWQASLP